MRKIIFAAVVGLGAAIPAVAQEIARESVPHRWIEKYALERLPELKYPAYYDELDKASAQAFAGRYKQALLTLTRVKNADPVRAALVKATALAAIGREEEALAALSAEAVAGDLRVRVLHARILADMGRYAAAVAMLKDAVQRDPQSLRARYYLGETLERTGDLAGAKEQYEWIYKTWYDQWMGLGAKNFDDAEAVTLMARAFDRWATLNGAYTGNVPLHKLILKMFVQAYDVIDRSYWPAHVAAAEYLMGHGNSPEALKELQAALAGNPNHVHTRVLLAMLALEKWNFDAAEKQLQAIRAVNEDAIEGHILKTRILLHERRPAEAEKAIGRVLARQPGNIEALGLLAAAHALQLKEDECRATLRRVEELDPDNATAPLEVAAQLAAMRQYSRAEKMYELAIERAPWMVEARNGLGLLLTQSGDEEKAKVVLEAAYTVDPFNYRTTNYLILLDKMQKMARAQTQNFVIMYDAASDPIIPEYFAEYLEQMHAAVCDVFAFRPPVKTYIEVFPNHDAFSARITGSPWIGTVGACTGRVIALCSPRRGENTLGNYNWAQVLRHEYTHTVTLTATENRISHWMTEGLAVAQEGVPLRWEWAPMLHAAVTGKRLFNMDALTWAFVRPRRPQDRTLAYAQSYWVCQFIREKWGDRAIADMMKAYREGKTEHQVFAEVLKTTPHALSRDFFAWAEKQVAGWGYDAGTTRKYTELAKKGEELMKKRAYREAIGVWEEAMRLRPMDPTPYLRLAGAYLSREVNEPRKALPLLIRLHQGSLKDNRIAKRISRLYSELGDVQGARQYALEAVYVDPYDMDAHELLLAACEKAGDREGVEREKRVMGVLARWIEENRRKTEAAEEQGAGSEQ